MKKDNNKAELIGAGIGGGAPIVGITTAASGASASTITWALAAIGGVVGGGMAAGIAIVAATPLAAAGIGYGIVKGIKALNNKNENKSRPHK